MKTSTMIAIVISVGGLFTTVLLGGYAISKNNQEVGLRAQVEAKQLDNKQELANLKNKFIETAQVSQKEADLLSEVFVKYANARSGQGGGSLVTMITESVPTINPTTLRNLQNIIESSRNSWVSRQKELIDINRVHTQLLREFPSNMLFSLLGRQEIKIIIVTSEESEKAFATGKEEATKLFK